MCSIEDKVSVGTADLKSNDYVVDLNSYKGRRTRKTLAMSIGLGAAVFLIGCIADSLKRETFSKNEMLATRNAIFGTFVACLLPGNQQNFTVNYVGRAGRCRLR